MPNQKQLNQMMRQMQKMQADMAAAQQALEEERIESTAGGGAVKAVVTGHGVIDRIEISPDVVDADDVEMLQDLVVAALNQALDEARELQQQRMGAVTGGLDLGNLGGLLG
jgi:DNA-binding YbaB/EbfC family protein